MRTIPQSALILAIEPDPGQAACVRRAVRALSNVELVLVDSRHAALASLAESIPAMILISAILAPSDEQALASHLRKRKDATHVEMMTIPLLDSGRLQAEKPRGLLDLFKRKKKEAQSHGRVSPRLFADEIKRHLDRVQEAQAASSRQPASAIPIPTEADVAEAGSTVERLPLPSELTAAEKPLAERIARLMYFNHPAISHAHGLEHDGLTGRLILVSDRVPGPRLSALLARASDRSRVADLPAALFVMRRLLSALQSLHSSTGVAHVAVAPERIVVSPRAQFVVVEAALAAADPDPSHDDPRLDIARIALIGMSIMLGRVVDGTEDASERSDLLGELVDVASLRVSAGFSTRLRSWFASAFTTDTGQSFLDFKDARSELADVEASGCFSSRRELKAFVNDLAFESVSSAESRALEADRIRSTRARQIVRRHTLAALRDPGPEPPYYSSVAGTFAEPAEPIDAQPDAVSTPGAREGGHTALPPPYDVGEHDVSETDRIWTQPPADVVRETEPAPPQLPDTIVEEPIEPEMAATATEPPAPETAEDDEAEAAVWQHDVGEHEAARQPVEAAAPGDPSGGALGWEDPFGSFRGPRGGLEPVASAPIDLRQLQPFDPPVAPPADIATAAEMPAAPPALYAPQTPPADPAAPRRRKSLLELFRSFRGGPAHDETATKPTAPPPPAETPIEIVAAPAETGVALDGSLAEPQEEAAHEAAADAEAAAMWSEPVETEIGAEPPRTEIAASMEETAQPESQTPAEAVGAPVETVEIESVEDWDEWSEDAEDAEDPVEPVEHVEIQASQTAPSAADPVAGESLPTEPLDRTAGDPQDIEDFVWPDDTDEKEPPPLVEQILAKPVEADAPAAFTWTTPDPATDIAPHVSPSHEAGIWAELEAPDEAEPRPAETIAQVEQAEPVEPVEIDEPAAADEGFAESFERDIDAEATSASMREASAPDASNEPDDAAVMEYQPAEGTGDAAPAMTTMDTAAPAEEAAESYQYVGETVEWIEPIDMIDPLEPESPSEGDAVDSVPADRQGLGASLLRLVQSFHFRRSAPTTLSIYLRPDPPTTPTATAAARPVRRAPPAPVAALPPPVSAQVERIPEAHRASLEASGGAQPQPSRHEPLEPPATRRVKASVTAAPAARADAPRIQGTTTRPAKRAGRTRAVAAVVIGAGLLGVVGTYYFREMANAPAAVLKPAPKVPSANGKTTGRLTITSDPAGGKVLVDGKLRGLTPLTIQELSPGSHAVVLETNRGSVRRTVQIVAGEDATLVESISEGYLVVFAPFEVQISEGQHLLATTDSGKILTPPGRHTFVLANKTLGYRETRVVDVNPGQTVTLNVKGAEGIVRINTPPGTVVTIDGQSVGTAPLSDLRVAAGSREIVLTHPLYGERRVVIDVTLSAPVVVNVNFR